MPDKTVLIADEDENLLCSIEYIVRQAGYRVLLARTGAQAVEIALAQAPDLLLLEAMMPAKDGYQVCQELRESGRLPGLVIIMLTARHRAADRLKGLALGVDEYMLKPFSTRDLLRRIRVRLGDEAP